MQKITRRTAITTTTTAVVSALAAATSVQANPSLDGLNKLIADHHSAFAEWQRDIAVWEPLNEEFYQWKKTAMPDCLKLSPQERIQRHQQWPQYQACQSEEERQHASGQREISLAHQICAYSVSDAEGITAKANWVVWMCDTAGLLDAPNETIAELFVQSFVAITQG